MVIPDTSIIVLVINFERLDANLSLRGVRPKVNNFWVQINYDGDECEQT